MVKLKVTCMTQSNLNEKIQKGCIYALFLSFYFGRILSQLLENGCFNFCVIKKERNSKLKREKLHKFKLQKVHVSFKHSSLHYLDKTIEQVHISQAPPSRQFSKIFDPVPPPFFPSRINFPCYFYLNERQNTSSQRSRLPFDRITHH